MPLLLDFAGPRNGIGVQARNEHPSPTEGSSMTFNGIFGILGSGLTGKS
jgi:hypothetical protein